MNNKVFVALSAGFRLRAMLVHEVFDKVLYLTPSARAQFSSGRIFNLVTTDAETLQMLFQNILGVISSPARIIGSMAMLYVQLGPSSLVALAVLILMMPAQVTGVQVAAPPGFFVQFRFLLLHMALFSGRILLFHTCWTLGVVVGVLDMCKREELQTPINLWHSANVHDSAR